MKKLFGFLAAVAFLAATGMSAASVTARAEETTHVVEPETKVCASLTPFAWYEFDDSENLGKDTMGRFDLTVAKSIAGTIEQKEDGGTVKAAFFCTRRSWTKRDWIFPTSFAILSAFL